jgi:homoserine kinase
VWHRRAPLIPGFARVKQAAMDHHALGASISGGGPSVFGWYERREDAQRAAAAMVAAFAEQDLASDALVSPINGPAATLVAEDAA